MTFFKSSKSGTIDELLDVLEPALQKLTTDEAEREEFRNYVRSIGVDGVVDFLFNGLEFGEQN